MVLTFSALASLTRWPLSAERLYLVSAGLFVLMGLSAGLYAVPLQVFLQARPAAAQKGRMIGAMNFTTWIGILASAACYGLCARLFGIDRISEAFIILAMLIFPVAIFYRPQDVTLSHFTTQVTADEPIPSERQS